MVHAIDCRGFKGVIHEVAMYAVVSFETCATARASPEGVHLLRNILRPDSDPMLPGILRYGPLSQMKPLEVA